MHLPFSKPMALSGQGAAKACCCGMVIASIKAEVTSVAAVVINTHVFPNISSRNGNNVIFIPYAGESY
jgi:hypothetical protein